MNRYQSFLLQQSKLLIQVFTIPYHVMHNEKTLIKLKKGELQLLIGIPATFDIQSIGTLHENILSQIGVC